MEQPIAIVVGGRPAHAATQLFEFLRPGKRIATERCSIAQARVTRSLPSISGLPQRDRRPAGKRRVTLASAKVTRRIHVSLQHGGFSGMLQLVLSGLSLSGR
jgi:hypothetical protein